MMPGFGSRGLQERDPPGRLCRRSIVASLASDPCFISDPEGRGPVLSIPRHGAAP